MARFVPVNRKQVRSRNEGYTYDINCVVYEPTGALSLTSVTAIVSVVCVFRTGVKPTSSSCSVSKCDVDISKSIPFRRVILHDGVAVVSIRNIVESPA